MSVALALFWYACFLLAVVLLCIAARREQRRPFLADGRPLIKRHPMEVVAYAAAWALPSSLIIAGVIDLVIWAGKIDVPTVSDIVHYTLNQYPWIGWLAAGIVYHLLIDRPAPPWR